MARKYDLMTELYKRTVTQITQNPVAWTSFLRSACRNYKCSFAEQVMIHAQRPDATAVLEIERWNNQFGRWVNKGAVGIAVFDEEYPRRTRLKYYFDVSDTHESRISKPLPIWEMQDACHDAVIEALENSFGELERKDNLEQALLSAADNTVTDNITDYYEDLLKRKQGSHLENMSEDDIMGVFRHALKISVSYMLFSRCGITDTESIPQTEEYGIVTNFNTPDTMNALGVAASDIAEMGIRVVAATVLNFERTQKKQIRTFAPSEKPLYNKSENEPWAQNQTERTEYYDDNELNSIELSYGGRLQTSEPDLAGGIRDNPWEIRINASQVSEGTSESDLYESAHDRQAEQSSDRSGIGGDGENGTADKTDGRGAGRDRSTQGDRSDEMGGIDEQHPSFGGGDSPLGTDLQLNSEDGLKAGNDKKLPAFLSPELISAILRYDRYLSAKCSEIQDYYMSHSNENERSEYSKSIYNNDYTEILFDGTRVGYKATDNGLCMWEGSYLTRKSESLFTWNLIADLTADLIERHEYLTSFHKPLKPVQTQLTMFDNTPVNTPENSFAISQQVIDEVLCSGGCERNSVPRIIAQFSKSKPDDENAKFLKNEYLRGKRGKGFLIGENKVSVWFTDNGISIAEGTSTYGSESCITVSYEQAAHRIGKLLDLGRYAPQEVLKSAIPIEMKECAESLWYMWGDISDEHKTDFPDFRHHGSFEDGVNMLVQAFGHPEQLSKIISAVSELTDAYKADTNVMRFRFHKPDILLERLQDLQIERRQFNAVGSFSTSKLFITNDELDALFIGGSSMQDGKYRIYSFFLQNGSMDERVKFLRSEYGTGGHGSFEENESHDSKGIEYSRCAIDKPYEKVFLPWNRVASRISELISSGRYLSEKETAYLPTYERTVLGREIYFFFQDKPDQIVRPYEHGVYIDDAIKAIAEQITNHEKAEEILTVMTDVLNGTAEFDRNYEYMQKAIADLQSYQDGTYSLFTKTVPAGKENAGSDSTNTASAAQYNYHLGDTVFIGTEEYEILSFAGDSVQLYNVSYPMFQEEMDKTEFERKLAENPLNDGLIAGSEPEAEVEPDENEPDTDDGISDTEATPVEQQPEVTPEAAPEVTEVELLPLLEKVKPKPRTDSRYIHPELPLSEHRNYRITNDELGYGGAKEKFRRNIEAIMTLKQTEQTDRLATPEEQEILAQYVGFGSLANAFDENKPNWANEYQLLKGILTDEEYAAARESTLSAFYTPPVVIKAMYKALESMGFSRGNLLEPSCGVGNFIGLLPDSMKECSVYGVELDSISSRIAQQLYQRSGITVGGFETTTFPDSIFDAAIGNVPFGQFKVQDKKYDKYGFLIHDYFFAKSLDKVRPGGIIAFITSKGTMDKENSSVRRYIAQRADFIGAIRLPDNTFTRNAGTEVTSDIIFLQKRDRLVDIDPEWTHIGTDENGIRMNSYFVSHPEMILGDMVMESTQFGMDSACKPYEGASLEDLLSDAVSNIHAEITEYEAENDIDEEDNSIQADPDVRNFSYTLYDGKLYYRENSRMLPQDVSVTAMSRIKGMLEIRDCVRTLIEYQTEDYPDEDIHRQQEMLNRLYDSFSAKYGLINSRANSSAFSSDSSYCLLCSLEVIDENGNLERKADMFTKRTIKPHIPVTSVDTVSDALAVSLSEHAKVDLEFMSQLTGKDEQTIINELDGVIFLNVGSADSQDSTYVTADEYLSGNVREKLKLARAAAQTLGNGSLDSNIRALEAVQPKDLTASEISVRLGATWIPTDTVESFIFELLSTPRYCQWNIKVHYSPFTAEWNVEGKSYDRGNVRANSTYGTSRINAYKIIEESLNLRDVRIFDYIEDAEGRRTPVLNKKETAIAQAKQEQIKEQFVEWVWKTPERREALCRLYNEKYNSIRPREYDGSHIGFVGINPAITLRTHQINAIAHIIYGGNTLLAHEVGAGKTFEMVAAAMESKRLGLCHKSLIVVPNHIIEQFAAEWLQLYPSANLLVATKKDFETQNRKKFCGRIATGDYDAVIIGHSQFEKIPMSLDRQRYTLQQQLDEVLEGLSELKSNRGENFSIKQLERTKKSIQQKLDKLNDQSRKDSVITFEELGVDRLFVDEAHYYKNLFLFTKMRNVGGIAQTEAQKSSDMFMKCRYLDELTRNKGVVFATGTPISNSMVEMYTMQRYLQYDRLKYNGLQHFDAWASTFGETVTAIELSPEGTGYRAKTRFAKFYNLPELMAMFKEVADIQTADMLHLPVPKANYHNEVIKPSEIQKEMVAALAERAERVRSNMVDPSIDNMLKITNDGRKLALDQRLSNDMLPDFEESKVSTCAASVYDIWQRTVANRSAQLIFCDLSTPHFDGSFNVYEDIQKKLVERGIPAEEIAFIHSADTEAKKLELFGKVRKGQVRVLLGSTFKMGSGTNCQDRLIALHDLDCPWRPSDLTQRSGRIIRQGNKNPEVEIYRYVTEGTFDAYLYQLVENKQRFIGQVMTSKSPVRVAEDVDESALSYAEIKALATGNPLIIEKCQLETDVAKLKMLNASHLSARYEMEDKLLKYFPQEIQRVEERIGGYKSDCIRVVENTLPNEDGFSPMTVCGELCTDKKRAGTAIIEACKTMTSPDAKLIGNYRGFDMYLSFDSFSKEYRIMLKGALGHSVALGSDIHGNITRLDNVLEGLSVKQSTCEEQLQNLLVQIKNAETEAKRPFPKEAELKEKTARLAELNIALNMDKKEKESTEFGSESEEVEPETRHSQSRDAR